MKDQPLPLTTHLRELRSRVFRILIAWTAASSAAWRWREEIFGRLLAPATNALGEHAKLQAIAPTEIFFTYMQCALLAGFILALPVFFWQVWAFVAPGLYPQEKRVALPFVLVSTALFLCGGWFGHSVVFPVIFAFFASFLALFFAAFRAVLGFAFRAAFFGFVFAFPAGFAAAFFLGAVLGAAARFGEATTFNASIGSAAPPPAAPRTGAALSSSLTGASGPSHRFLSDTNA